MSRSASVTGRATAAVIERACRRIEAAEPLPGLAELAAEAGWSEAHFSRSFRKVAGVSLREFVEAVKRGRSAASLRRCGSVTEAIYDAGFESSGRFYEKADAFLGMKPQAFRRGGEGETIRFAIGRSSLGAVLVASSSRGVCGCFLGGDPEALLRDLERRFPRAELVGADGDYERTVARVIALVEDPNQGAELPLDLRGTAFQQRVWQALRRVPAGRTVSYAELAEMVGEPKAVRAVAGACAANPVAIAVPCHRVVRRDGGLSGYRWGVERKRELLRREAR